MPIHRSRAYELSSWFRKWSVSSLQGVERERLVCTVLGRSRTGISIKNQKLTSFIICDNKKMNVPSIEAFLIANQWTRKRADFASLIFAFCFSQLCCVAIPLSASQYVQQLNAEENVIRERKRPSFCSLPGSPLDSSGCGQSNREHSSTDSSRIGQTPEGSKLWPWDSKTR